METAIHLRSLDKKVVVIDTSNKLHELNFLNYKS